MAKRSKPAREAPIAQASNPEAPIAEVEARSEHSEVGRVDPAAVQEASLDTTAADETIADVAAGAGESRGAEADVWAEDRAERIEADTPPAKESDADSAVWSEAAGGTEGEPTPEGEGALSSDDAEDTPVIFDSSHMESIIESLLFASDRVLSLGDLKRLLGERDSKKVTAAVESLLERHKGSGIEVVRLANGWHLRTNPEHARWVSRLLAGRPMRLSRAMMETLAIVAYRQPITRPEIDDIRGVDCGPVLKTLLERGLVRIIGKKEEVGRPLLYGTTPEFLRVFSLRELTDLPTLREYAELSSEQKALVDAEHGLASGADSSGGGGTGTPAAPGSTASTYNVGSVARSQLPEEPDDNDPLLDELDSATKVASKILGTVNEPAAEAAPEPEGGPPVPPPSGPIRDS